MKPKTKFLLFLFILILSVSLVLPKSAKADSVEVCSSSTYNLFDKANVSTQTVSGSIKFTQTKLQTIGVNDGMLYVYVPNWEYFFDSAPTVNVKVYDEDCAVIDTIEAYGQTSMEESYKPGDYTPYEVEIDEDVVYFTLEIDAINSSYLNVFLNELMVATESDFTYTPYVEGPRLLTLLESKKITIKVTYAKPMSESTIKSCLAAYDETDGNVTQRIVLDCSDYLDNKTTVGEYECSVSVTDSHSNTKESTFYISVVDEVAPTLTKLVENIYLSTNTDYDTEDLQAFFTAVDGYDGDITSEIEITNLSDITSTKDKEEKNMVVVVEDSSGNKVTQTVKVTFRDNSLPVFNGPQTISLTTTIGASLDTIIDMYFTLEKSGADISDSITYQANSYLGNENKVGEYTITLSGADEYGNTATKTFTLCIVDNDSPFIYINSQIIDAVCGAELSIENITQMLFSSGALNAKHKYNVRVLEDSYTGNGDKEGTYTMTLEYEDLETNEVVPQTLAIRVLDNTYGIVSYNTNSINTKEIVILAMLGFSLALISVSAVLLIKSKRKNYN